VQRLLQLGVQFDFRITAQHVPGEANGLADALSRLHWRRFKGLLVGLLVSQGAALESSAQAPGTWEQYGRHFRYWMRFCVVFGLMSYVFSPTEMSLYAYAAFLARTCHAATVK
jgi:hypothetical protein